MKVIVDRVLQGSQEKVKGKAIIGGLAGPPK